MSVDLVLWESVTDAFTLGRTSYQGDHSYGLTISLLNIAVPQYK